MKQETRTLRFHCPHCGEKVRTWLEDRSRYACPRCNSKYLVLLDNEHDRAAFFDEFAEPLPEPLYLPSGSIRGIIALSMIYCCWHLAVMGRALPSALLSLVLAIVAFYFGFRTKAAMLSDRVYDPAARREQPLFLPSGAIRFALVAALLALAGLLYSQGRLLSHQKTIEFFIILGGLVLGWLFSKIVLGPQRRKGKALLGHLKGLLGLLAAGGLTTLFVTGYYQDLSERWVSVMCATVSFYFGSRT